MNLPLFTLLVFLTIAYFADEILAFFPEGMQAKYYQLWMDMQHEKEVDADTLQPLEEPFDPLSSSQIKYPHFAFKSEQVLQASGFVQSDFVFGLNVIRESA